jgi:hypothetical protein
MFSRIYILLRVARRRIILYMLKPPPEAPTSALCPKRCPSPLMTCHSLPFFPFRPSLPLISLFFSPTNRQHGFIKKKRRLRSSHLNVQQLKQYQYTSLGYNLHRIIICATPSSLHRPRLQYRHRPQRLVPRVCLHVPEPLYHVHSTNDPPKHRVLAVQMRRWRQGDEELRSVGVGSGVGHGQDASAGVLEIPGDLVLEFGSVDGLPAAASAGRIATLDLCTSRSKGRSQCRLKAGDRSECRRGTVSLVGRGHTARSCWAISWTACCMPRVPLTMKFLMIRWNCRSIGIVIMGSGGTLFSERGERDHHGGVGDSTDRQGTVEEQATGMLQAGLTMVPS